MLNPNAQKWVVSLRSGKYKQCKNRLTHAGRYCCLGVAASISPIPRSEWVHQVSLPKSVMEWLGLSNNDGKLTEDPYGPSLASLNDCDHKTFAEIADIIESEPAWLFTGGGQ